MKPRPQTTAWRICLSVCLFVWLAASATVRSFVHFALRVSKQLHFGQVHA